MKKRVLMVLRPTPAKGIALVCLVMLATAALVANTKLNSKQSKIDELTQKLEFVDKTGTEDGNIKITEVGYEMQLPDDLKDIVYFYNPRNHTSYFSTRSLMAQAFSDAVAEATPELYHCSPGSGAIGYIQHGLNEREGKGIIENRQVGEYNFTLYAPPKDCAKTEPVKKLQAKQAVLLRTAFGSARQYKDINFKRPAAPDAGEAAAGL